jgi:putative selenium metabolism protein SsnA
MKRLIRAARIWDGGSRFIEGGGILIQGDHIEAVLTREELTMMEIPPSVERIDGVGKLAIPGLINAHTHLYSSLARGMTVSPFTPSSFTEILEQLWWRLDKALDAKTVRISGQVGAMEAARCGVTTLIDHHASPNAVLGSLTSLKEAVCDEVGLRAALCYEVSDRDGPTIRDQGIEENLAFLHETTHSNTQVAGLFGLHASFTLSEETLDRVAQEIPDDAGIHIHVAEGPEDELQCLEQHGLRIADRLKGYGLLRPTSVLAHCLHVDGAERRTIKEHDAVVVHNPRSNMNNAVGTFALDRFLGDGILVTLGTDGLGTNMLGELMTAGLLQKQVLANPLADGFPKLDQLLFHNNPRLAERLFGVRSGKIAPGYAADIALVAYTPPTPIRAENVLGHLLFGIAVHDLRVSDLFVAGRPILRDGRFVDLDEEGIYARAQDAANRLWKRLA